MSPFGDAASLSKQFATLPVAPNLPPRLRNVWAQASTLKNLEEAASFACWWLDAETSQVLLSAAASRLLNLDSQHFTCLDDCFVHVVSEDMLTLMAMLPGHNPQGTSSEFRVISTADGLRWLRLSILPAEQRDARLIRGILMDVTPAKHAVMRERLGFELTEFLVGSHSFDDAITNVIQLVCKNLGWEWGAYWALEQLPQGGPQLACRQHWHHPDHDMSAFRMASATLCMKPGEGLVGKVWQTGVASWVEDMAIEPHFLRRDSARECRLWSGYVFPVTYLSEDGHRHSSGVLEFYSILSRQPDAQLPSLAATLGALVAQTAQRLAHQATILHLAQVDVLTELANRGHFYAMLTQACVGAGKSASRFGLMFIDLDRFKPINDAFGHEAGNVVLREFALRLRQLAPSGALVGRLGGDEFGLLVPAEALASISSLAEAVLEAARTPFTYEGLELTVSASVGISTFPENGASSPEMLRSADAAMYRIKQNGRNGCEVSAPQAMAHQQASLARRLTIETGLHHALLDREFFLQYQPIFDMATQRMSAVEALIRWRLPNGELVPPDLFIPIAEQSHLIVQIGKWVISQACRDLASLQSSHFKNLKVHVNMAASEFTSHKLPQELQALVRAFDLAPHQLCFELTEGMLMTRPDQVIPVMRDLRQFGFGISLDDFGMGHSSLSLLKNLPISSLKIDRSFVRDLPHQSNDRAIVKTIVDLGRHMHLDVVAEGVETTSQLAILQQSGCTLIQGYLLSQPTGIAELKARYPNGNRREELPHPPG